MISKRLTDAAGQYELEELDRSLKQCLSQWFSGGFLQLEQLTWQSSCDIMEKVYCLLCTYVCDVSTISYRDDELYTLILRILVFAIKSYYISMLRTYLCILLDTIFCDKSFQDTVHWYNIGKVLLIKSRNCFKFFIFCNWLSIKIPQQVYSKLSFSIIYSFKIMYFMYSLLSWCLHYVHLTINLSD